MQQVEIISLEDLIPENYNYRKFVKFCAFDYVEKQLKKLEKDNPFKGYGLLRLFKCLLLQFMENISDLLLVKGSFLLFPLAFPSFQVVLSCFDSQGKTLINWPILNR